MFDHLPLLLSSSPPPLIHVHDPHDQLLYNSNLDVIRKAQRAFVLIDGVECISQRVLFSRIINGLANWAPNWEDGAECWGGSALGVWDSSFDAFAQALKALWRSILDTEDDEEADEGDTLMESRPRKDAMVIMLKHTESLKEVLPQLFVPFTRLSELTGTPSCVILVSQCSWTSLRPPLGASPTPLFFNIPPLDSTQIINHLVSLFQRASARRRSAKPIHPYNPRLKPLYEQFAQALYAACSPTTNDPAQLAYVASARWPGFVAPLLNDWTAEDAVRAEAMDVDQQEEDEDESVLYPLPTNDGVLRLLHTFKPTFIPAINALLPRLTTAQAWAAANEPPATVRLSQPLSLSLPSISSSSTLNASVPSAIELIESRLRGLTRRTKILLLASYVASFNPARTDARMFERTTEGVAKRARRKKRAAAPVGGGAGSPSKKVGGGGGPMKSMGPAKLSRALTGPGAFPLDRLLAIYEALLIENVGDELDALDDDDARNHMMNDWSKEVGRVQLVGTVAQLVQTQLLQRTSTSISNEAYDGSTQFKSNVSYDMAVRIAKSLKVELGDILWDVERL
ncbi:hypothetical protein DL93DRAFT_2224917 [Clavulina sp. PMI_390]|nr:hypothetical protein DL93DRAFT_2224917 [Clavulina sp. PMI_390]